MMLSMYILLSTIVVGTVAIIYYYNVQKRVVYVDRDYFAKVVSNASYFKNMNGLDLIARNSSSKQEYQSRYLNAYTTFTEEEKENLKRLISIADKHCKIGFPLLHKIPWKLAKVESFIENGYPHTLGDIIILSDRFFMNSKMSQVGTLIHEKVHVLQRKYPEWTQYIIDRWGFKKYPKDSTLPRRNNPDLSRDLYGTNEGPIAQIYSSESPSSLADSTAMLIRNDQYVPITSNDLGFPNYVGQVEHPYEIMACMIPEVLMNNNSESNVMEVILRENFR